MSGKGESTGPNNGAGMSGKGESTGPGAVETACMIGIGLLLGSAVLALILIVALEPLRV
jgi:hypothetical protein